MMNIIVDRLLDTQQCDIPILGFMEMGLSCYVRNVDVVSLTPHQGASWILTLHEGAEYVREVN